MNIQDKGQFYVRAVTEHGGLVPIDNFIFRADDGIEVKLDHCGRPFIGVSILDGRYRFLDTQAEALRVMADVLDGSISMQEIAAWDDWQ